MLKKFVTVFTVVVVLSLCVGIDRQALRPSADDGVRIETTVARADDPQRSAAPISAYDELMRRAAAERGLDWRLMSAIAYHESRFREGVVSQRGACGLMQIMPDVARQFGVPAEEIMEPETNVRLAAQLLALLGRTIRFAPATPDKERLSIILASYVGGSGHVADARRLARKAGENPDVWAVVSGYLERLADSTVYTDPVVRCGRFTGVRQTIAYVDNVLGHYDSYRRIASR